MMIYRMFTGPVTGPCILTTVPVMVYRCLLGRYMSMHTYSSPYEIDTVMTYDDIQDVYWEGTCPCILTAVRVR